MAHTEPPSNLEDFPTITNNVDPAGSDQSAIAIFKQTLNLYGLGSLADFVWQQHVKNIPDDQIWLNIRQTPEYKARFPAMDYIAQQGRAMSEGDYIRYEKGVSEVMRAAGLPQGFYDQPEDFTNFIKADVSPSEIQDRVNTAKVAVYNSDPATLQALHDYYGVNAGGNAIGDATAYFLDPDRALPAIQKQMLAAQEAGAATRTGYGALSRADAERIATLGITPGDAQKQFGTLAGEASLYTNLQGEGGVAPTAEQGLASAFEDNATAKQAIELRRQQRKAVFQQGGGFTQTQSGMTGI